MQVNQALNGACWALPPAWSAATPPRACHPAGGACGWGFDAVEGARRSAGGAGKPLRCGDDATAALRRLVDGRKLTCDARGRERYRRIVAVCRVDGRDVGAKLVRRGWALDYRHYSGRA